MGIPDLRDILIAELEKEVECLREDAERYRWLRDNYPYAAHIAITTSHTRPRLLITDAAIDAAMESNDGHS